MSAIIATPDTFGTIRKTIGCLRAQSARDRMEVVIVAPDSRRAGIPDAEMSVFSAWQLVETGRIMSVSEANAAGIRAARAPVVALCEDHAFPDTGWAEALLEAHRGAWAAVGPVIRNANPDTLVSWADLLVAYAPWLDPAPAGPREHLPGHNSSYKREILLEYGAELVTMMASESVLHWDLRRRGHKLYLEPGAKTAHTNFSLLTSWLRSKFYSGRVFAASRSRAWPLSQRLAYAAASPLIPLVRVLKIIRDARNARQPAALLLRVLPVMSAGLAVSAAGELAGYGFGPGNAVRQLSDFEFHRTRHLTVKDREALSRETL